MKWIRLVYRNKRKKILLLLAGLLLSTHPATGKLAVDFNPNLDFSKFKTFAFIGGVEQLVRMQLNPDQLNNRIHRAVTRELTAKGLREVKPEENPDLVVRYWVNSQKSVDVAASVLCQEKLLPRLEEAEKCFLTFSPCIGMKCSNRVNSWA